MTSAQQPPEAAAPRDEESDGFLVVGIGASAGGLEALQDLFSHLPADPGMAFVVVQHLDPTHESRLAELLGSSTAMPVRQIRDATAIAPDQVYVIPPNAQLTIEGGVLHTAAPAEPRGQRLPINSFFRSLAEDQGENAVCIVLSGGGSDGILGLAAIKENGGVTITQRAEDARFDSMPRSALATGLVDYVLAVEEMPGKLAELSQHLRRLKKIEPDLLQAVANERLERICAVLRERTGHDFSHYKRNTVVRRIKRRMLVRQFSDVEKYVEWLQRDDKEPYELFKDLLIGVTQFFRDPEALEALSKVITKILVASSGKERIRIWVPACATGEEAYSIAILCFERLSLMGQSIPVQIFATDVDRQALEVARRAIYPPAISEQLSRERLERFFERKDGSYSVRKDIREMCIFSPHNLISDPPFGRLDLISCRNLLIYFDATLQRQLFPMFHYALQKDGYLFLGPSESIPKEPDLFHTVDAKHRVFQAREQRSPYPTLPREGLFGGAFSQRLSHRVKEVAGQPRPEPPLNSLLERLLLEKHTPPTVVVNGQGEIVYSTGQTGPYLQLPLGQPNFNVLNMVRRPLRIGLRTGFHRATTNKERVRQENLRIEVGPKLQTFDLLIEPLADDEHFGGFYLIMFIEHGRPSIADEVKREIPDHSSHDEVVQQLESELSSTRDSLQSAVEELETSNEELKSSNEELLSLNEEFQSANEELQTSKEELQSVNEELQTVNAELNKKIEELDRSNSDLRNFLESTEIPTIFLDDDLVIRNFTPVAEEVFRLREGDIGRPVTDIAARFDGGDLIREVREVQRTRERHQLDVHRADGDLWYLLRILPYRTGSNGVSGVVLTFTDVTDQKQREQDIQKLSEELQRRVTEVETLLDVVPAGVSIAGDVDCRYIRTNRWGASLLQMAPESNVSKSGAEGAPYKLYRDGAELAPEEMPMQLACRSGKAAEMSDLVLERGDGSRIDLHMWASPIFDDAGQARGAIGAFVDVTPLRSAERRALERVRQQSAVADLGTAALFERSLRTLMDKAATMVHDVLDADFCKILKLLPEERSLQLIAGVGWKEGLVGELVISAGEESQAGYALQAGEPVVVEDLAEEDRFSGGPLLAEHGVASGISVMIGGVGGPYGVLGAHSREKRKFSKDEIAFLQTVANVLAAAIIRQHAEEERWRSEERLQMAVSATNDGIWDYDLVTGKIWWNPAYDALFGTRPPETADSSQWWINHIHPEDRTRVVDSFDEALASESERWECAYRYQKTDGTFADVIDRAFIARDQKEQALRVVGAMLDVTEQKRTEAVLREADQRKDAFLAMLAHELRNPLAPIRTAVEVMKRSPEALGEDLRELSEIIDRQTGHLTHLVDDLLEVSRISRGKIYLDRKRLDLREVVREGVATFRKEAEERRLTLEATLPEEPVYVSGDRSRLIQVLGNLLQNSLKFTDPGGSVAVALTVEGDRAVLYVEDTGIGMDPTTLDYVFEPFTQADKSLDRTRGGIGLGLSLVKGLVELHRGKVRAESPGLSKGTTFTVELPTTVAPAPAPDPEPAPKVRGLRILLVDDNKDAVKLMRRLLEMDGHAVATAHDGREAIDAALAAPPEVLLCDIGLPGGIDGYEVARRLRQTPALRDTPFIALTGYGRKKDRDRAHDAGFTAHLTKPVSVAALRQTLADLGE